MNEINRKNNNIQKIIKDYLPIMNFNTIYYESYQKYMIIIIQYNNILKFDYNSSVNKIDKN